MRFRRQKRGKFLKVGKWIFRLLQTVETTSILKIENSTVNSYVCVAVILVGTSSWNLDLKVSAKTLKKNNEMGSFWMVQTL